MNTVTPEKSTDVSDPVHQVLATMAPLAFELCAVVRADTWQFLSLCQPGRKLLGIPPHDDLTQRHWTEHVDEDLARTIREEAMPIVDRGDIWKGSGVLTSRNGLITSVRLFIAGLPAGGSDIRRLMIGATDRHAIDEIRQVLQHEQLLLHALLDNLGDAIYFKDERSRFIRVSAAKARRTGNRQAHELVGESDFDHFAEEYAQKTFATEQQIMATGRPVLNVEEKQVWPDGRITWAATSKFPLRDWHGKIVGTFGVSQDITARKIAEREHKRLEAQRQLAQKMESIGRLAAGVAHEVNTPTQFIGDNTHFLLDAFQQMTRVLAAYRGLRDSAAQHTDCQSAIAATTTVETDTEIDYLLAEIPRTLEQTSEGIARISRIVRSLKEFAHPNPPEKQPANLNHAIETAVAVSRHEWKLVADVVTELDPDLPSVPCVLDEFNQAILNLIVNASHTIGDVVADRPGERGRITVRSRRERETVVIEVEDTGTGISPAVQKRIFEPYFTTKAVGKGTGQGLALVHTSIVKNHGGTIGFTTEPGQGTTFRITLPINPIDTPDEESVLL